MNKMKLDVESLVVVTFATHVPQAVAPAAASVSEGITDCSCRPYFCLPSARWGGTC